MKFDASCFAQSVVGSQQREMVGFALPAMDSPP